MVKLEFKRPVEDPFNRRGTLRPGIHTLEDDYLTHWGIQGMIAAGDIIIKATIPNASPVPQPKPQNKPEPVVRQPGVFANIKIEEIKPKSKIIEDVMAKVEDLEKVEEKPEIVETINKADTKPETVPKPETTAPTGLKLRNRQRIKKETV